MTDPSAADRSADPSAAPFSDDDAAGAPGASAEEPAAPGRAGRRLPSLRDQSRARRLHRSQWFWLVVVVVIVTAGGTLANWLLVDRDPEEPVEGWLQAMVDGRSRQGLALFDAAGETGAALMPNAAYRGAEQRISEWEIVDVEQDGGTARVTASVRWPEGQVPEGAAQGEEHTWSVHRVTRTGLLNDSWDLDDPDASTLTVEAPGVAAISLNGETLSLDPQDRTAAAGSGGAWSWEAMPGEFAVDLPQGGDYVLAEAVEPALVRLGDPQPQQVRIAVEPSPTLWDEVDRQIEHAIGQCLSSGSVSPEDCPASQRWAEGGVPRVDAEDDAEIEEPSGDLPDPEAGTEITDVEWELLRRPALWLVPSEEGALHWQASDHQEAQARLSYREDGRQVRELVTFPVHAEVASDGEDAEVGIDLR